MTKLLKEYMSCMSEVKTAIFFMVTGDIARNTTMCKGKISPEAGGCWKV